MFIASQAHSQKVFNNVNLTTERDYDMLSFAMPNEANVLHYRIEASNDKNTFDVVGTVKSTGNSVHARGYSHRLYGSSYKYYRVGRVCMGGSLRYSQVVSLPSPKQNSEPALFTDARAVAASR